MIAVLGPPLFLLIEGIICNILILGGISHLTETWQLQYFAQRFLNHIYY
jgi:hypothetical protein